MSAWTRIYGRLPAPARSVAASLRGYWLRSWRYGPETDRLVDEVLERDQWRDDQWQIWREERLARILHRAATRVPYYREQWSARRQRGDRASWERLENWPILSKAPLRENPAAFVADDCDVRRMFPVETSGTLGTPLRLWRSRPTERSWYAIFEARLRLWNGVSRRDRWANIGGQRVTRGGQRKPPFWVWNRGMRQLYLSSYHANPDVVPFYLDAMRRYRVTYLLGYPSAMHAIARVAVERGIPVPKLRVVVSNAESLFEFQRETIARAFDCSVRNTYGQAEIVCAASECPSGTMHLWPDVGVTECIRDDPDQRIPRSQVGSLVCTGLINTDMPLVRYDTGDRAALGDSAEPCACGRLLPVLQSLDGRAQDLIITPSGSPVGGLDTVFHSGLPMFEAQIVQETLHRIRIKVVPAPGFGDRHRQDLVRGVRARIGTELEVLVDAVESIPRTSAGKFRLQISMIAAGRLP